MKTGAGIAIGLSVALAAGGGYWLGQRPVANHRSPLAVATHLLKA
jgi:Cu(I)/Ag(I) efflux system membrane fusion protein